MNTFGTAEAGQDELVEVGSLLSEDIERWRIGTGEVGTNTPILIVARLNWLASQLEAKRSELAGSADSEVERIRRRILQQSESVAPPPVPIERVRTYENPIANCAVRVVTATFLAAQVGFGPARLVYRSDEIACLYGWCFYFLDAIPNMSSDSAGNAA